VRDGLEVHLNAERLQTTAVTCFELLNGAGENKRGQAVRQLIDGLNVLPLDRAAARRAAEVRRKLDRKGEAIGMGDSLIASIALAHNLALFTRNRSLFERVENLELVKMSESVA
jgi:predicted nucleic acid-binding protein